MQAPAWPGRVSLGEGCLYETGPSGTDGPAANLFIRRRPWRLDTLRVARGDGPGQGRACPLHRSSGNRDQRNVAHADILEWSSHWVHAMTLGVRLREVIVADVLGSWLATGGGDRASILSRSCCLCCQLMERKGRASALFSCQPPLALSLDEGCLYGTGPSGTAGPAANLCVGRRPWRLETMR